MDKTENKCLADERTPRYTRSDNFEKPPFRVGKNIELTTTFDSGNSTYENNLNQQIHFADRFRTTTK